MLRSSEFATHASTSLWSTIVLWILALLDRVLRVVQAHPTIGVILRIATILALFLIASRTVYVAVARRDAATLHGGTDAEHGTDWAATAQRLAAAGQFTDAAHALYLALLTAAARRGFVTLHESKTAGDYLRELRRRHASIDLRRFTEFTRSYEIAIYGIGHCDADRYSQLESLATTLLGAPR